MTEREKFEAWCKDYFDCHSESFNLEPLFGYYNSVSSKTFYGKLAARYSDVWMLFKTWQACAEAMSERIEEYERTLRVLHTWAGVDDALVPAQVRALTFKALHIGAKESE